MRIVLITALSILMIIGCESQLTDSNPATSNVTRGNEQSAIASKATNANNCDLNAGSYASLQAAVDDASPGDVVCADGGTYREQIVINKDLTLLGFGSPRIVMPESPSTFEIPESGSKWQPIVFAFGGSLDGSEVSGSATVDVTVTGFTVDGDDQQTSGRAVGIFFRNVKSSYGITQNDVQKMAIGGGETFGILAYGDSEITIADNAVNGYERGGIGVNGDGGPFPDPVAKIKSNTITGSGDGNQVAWAPNGIQVGFGAAGAITDNVVQRNRWASGSNGSWSASCILVFESNKVSLKNNDVEDCDAGIAVEAWGWFLPSADESQVAGNRVTDAIVGVSLRALDFGGFTSTTPSVSNGKVVRNVLRGGGLGNTGIAIIESNDPSSAHEPVASNNKVINNDIDGFDTPILEEGTDTKENANTGSALP